MKFKKIVSLVIVIVFVTAILTSCDSTGKPKDWGEPYVWYLEENAENADAFVPYFDNDYNLGYEIPYPENKGVLIRFAPGDKNGHGRYLGLAYDGTLEAEHGMEYMFTLLKDKVDEEILEIINNLGEDYIKNLIALSLIFNGNSARAVREVREIDVTKENIINLVIEELTDCPKGRDYLIGKKYVAIEPNIEMILSEIELPPPLD